MKIERLLKLAKHLKNGKLGHEKFDYNWFNYGAFEPNRCGTLGCALGELPIIDRRNWMFNGNSVRLRTSDSGEYANSSAQKYFDITYAEVNYLFIPDSYRPFEDNNLPRRAPHAKATRYEVADHILNFISVKIKRLEV